MAYLFLRELSKLDLSLDVYSNEEWTEFPELLRTFDGKTKRCLSFPFEWEWNSWYGRNRKVAFVMSFIRRLPVHGKIVNKLLTEHKKAPYDAIIQFSQGELFKLGKFASAVPIVLYPCVHAAGERRWCRREVALSRVSEPWWWRWARDLYLGYRSLLQKRDYRRARGVIGMSRRFNRHVMTDYGIAADRLGVVYHPIEPPTTHVEAPQSADRNHIRLLFVGRISVRKGIEMLTELVPPLLLKDPGVEITVVGAASLWSDYEYLLKDLPKERCEWLRSLSNDKVHAEMRRADILLVPSHYEPGGIVVGEALANGMIIVASDEVGSAENLPRSVCRQFRRGDKEEFASKVEEAIADVRRGACPSREAVRAVAAQFFDPSAMTSLLLAETERLVSASVGNRDAK